MLGRRAGRAFVTAATGPPHELKDTRMPLLNPDHLQLTDFMDLPTLQEIQDSFAAVASVHASITDADGNLLTQPAPTKDFLRRQRAIAAVEDEAAGGIDRPQREGAEYVAPIIVNNQRLGTIRMSPSTDGAIPIDEARLASLATKVGLDAKQVKQIAKDLLRDRK